MDALPPEAAMRSDALKAARERAVALLHDADALRHSNPQRAMGAVNEAIELARRLKDNALAGRGLSTRSVCQRNLSELVASAQSANEASRLFADLEDTEGEATALINYGIALSLVGQMSEALSVFERARRLNRNIDNQVGEADALMDIAVVYNMLGEDERAIALYGEVLPIYESLGDRFHVATTLNNLAFARIGRGIRLAEGGGETVQAQELYRQAVIECERALASVEGTDHPDFVVICLDTLSTALREIGDYARCFENLARQMELARALEGRRMEAVTLANLGEVQRRTGAIEAAIATLEQADALYSSFQLMEQHAGLLLSLVSAYEAAGRLAEALESHRRYHRIETQIKSAAAAEKMQVLEARFELEKLESELEQAQHRHAELAALNAQLSSVDHERSVLLEQLEKQSFEDSLTGLHNRRSLDVRLDADLRRTQRYAGRLSVALADIDYFKRINDQLSHAVGDDVLRTIASIMRESIRVTDYVARYGGEEFALVFPETSLEEAAAVCEKIRERIASYPWESIHPEMGGDLNVTISFGVTEAASYFQKHDALVAYADTLLYRAKNAGRNQVHADPPEPTS
ncbi:MAG: tetratricopeptide repeat-containing diguanylate cyclase [Burkholderiaceae bacterium]|jgi:diguanylate cyclase (GGDEF)-like protein